MFQTNVVEKIKVCILGSVTFFPQNRTVYEIMRANVVGPDSAQMTVKCVAKKNAICMLNN
jgi:hypothetical protein